MMQTLRTAQIGRCGELLVQYLLLLRGIESAPMTTDSGIDLVAYAAKTEQIKGSRLEFVWPANVVHSRSLIAKSAYHAG